MTVLHNTLKHNLFPRTSLKEAERKARLGAVHLGKGKKADICMELKDALPQGAHMWLSGGEEPSNFWEVLPKRVRSMGRGQTIAINRSLEEADSSARGWLQRPQHFSGGSS